MSHPALAPHPVIRTANAFSGRVVHLAVFAALMLLAAIYAPDRQLGIVLLAGSATLAAMAFLISLFSRRHGRARETMHDAVAAFIENDASPSFTTDADGAVLQRNQAARERFGDDGDTGETLARALRDLFANPASVLARLQGRAEARGAAREDIVTRRGHVRLSIHRIGEDRFLWRLEDLVERPPAGRGGESLSLPMMTVGASGTVLFMNDALRRLLGGRVKTLDRIFADLPLKPDSVHVVSGAEGPVRVRVVEIESTGGRQEVFLIPAGDEPQSVAATLSASGPLEGLPVALLHLSRAGTLLAANKSARELL
ncbi:MAG: hybrid sensor histidine kinase/response regulator, partial [Tropicimonas sp.]